MPSPSPEVVDSVVQLDDIVLPVDGALQPFSLSINKGDVCLLTGPLSAGKTSLVKALLGLISINAGRISLFGQQVSNMNFHELQKLRMRVGVLFEEGGLIDSWTVYENLALPLRYHGKFDEEKISEKIQHYFKKYALDMQLLNRLATDLNTVQRRDIASLRIILLQPELLIVDSKMSDDELQYVLNSRFGRRLELSIQTILLVAPPSVIPLLGKDSCKVIVMMEGCIVAQGNLDELLKHPDSKVRDWLFTELEYHAGDAH